MIKIKTNWGYCLSFRNNDEKIQLFDGSNKKAKDINVLDLIEICPDNPCNCSESSPKKTITKDDAFLLGILYGCYNSQTKKKIEISPQNETLFNWLLDKFGKLGIPVKIEDRGIRVIIVIEDTSCLSNFLSENNLSISNIIMRQYPKCVIELKICKYFVAGVFESTAYVDNKIGSKKIVAILEKEKFVDTTQWILYLYGVYSQKVETQLPGVYTLTIPPYFMREFKKEIYQIISDYSKKLYVDSNDLKSNQALDNFKNGILYDSVRAIEIA